MPEQDESRHGKRLIDRADQGRKGSPRVVPSWQFGGKEEIGLDFGRMNGFGVVEHVAMHVDFSVSELKQKVYRCEPFERVAF
jgi:hypothetical protein